jgi:hypothetical protein
MTNNTACASLMLCHGWVVPVRTSERHELMLGAFFCMPFHSKVNANIARLIASLFNWGLV